MPLILLALGCAPLRAQPPSPDNARGWPVDTVLARLERDTRARVVSSRATQVSVDILDLRNAPEARRDSVLNGLERIALSSDDSNVRSQAVSLIGFAGYAERSTPARGIVRRLERIYQAHRGSGLHFHLLGSMPDQADRRAALAFLRSVAAEPNTDPNAGEGPEGYFGHGEPRVWALERMAEMGEEGRQVLQEMHRSGEARSPQARAVLAGMARRGFPVRDARRPRPRP